MQMARIIDANANRAAEGLRVLEDLARFVAGAGHVSTRAKDLRHRLRSLVPNHIVAGRDSPGDVGATVRSADEAIRGDVLALVRANAARAQEALRVLEETAKLVGLDVAGFSAVRYGVYELESAVLTLIPGWRLRTVRLYALVDTALCADPVAVAGAVVRGGAGAVQLRAKELPLRAYRDLALHMQAVVKAEGGLFVVNDHVAVAAAIAADGVHVGQDDLDVADVRRVVGPLCAIGVSVHEAPQLARAQTAGADYVGLGPMFATATKAHEPARGPQLLDALREDLQVPSFAIGGLTPERLVDLLPRIPHGIAVAGDLCRAVDPEARARTYRELLDAGT